jgi:hypothetical protein
MKPLSCKERKRKAEEAFFQKLEMCQGVNPSCQVAVQPYRRGGAAAEQGAVGGAPVLRPLLLCGTASS